MDFPQIAHMRTGRASDRKCSCTHKGQVCRSAHWNSLCCDSRPNPNPGLRILLLAKNGSQMLRIQGHAFALGSFVDNLFATGFDAESAVGILNDAETYLEEKWKLKIGCDSKVVLPAKGAETTAMAGWTIADRMKCLGQILSNNGTIAEDFEETERKMWGSFYRNLQPGLRGASQKARLGFLSSSIKPVASFRWSRWPFQASYAKRLDYVQTSMIGRLENIRPRLGEEPSCFFRRRAQRCNQLANISGKWSCSWRRHVCTWRAHLERGHDQHAWAHKFFNHQAEEWLSTDSCSSSRLRTRVCPGRPSTRWFEGVHSAGASGRTLLDT